MRKTTEKFSMKKLQALLALLLLVGSGVLLVLASLLPMPKATIVYASLPLEQFSR